MKPVSLFFVDTSCDSDFILIVLIKYQKYIHFYVLTILCSSKQKLSLAFCIITVTHNQTPKITNFRHGFGHHSSYTFYPICSYAHFSLLFVCEHLFTFQFCALMPKIYQKKMLHLCEIRCNIFTQTGPVQTYWQQTLPVIFHFNIWHKVQNLVSSLNGL